jgi:hypothetical protein
MATQCRIFVAGAGCSPMHGFYGRGVDFRSVTESSGPIGLRRAPDLELRSTGQNLWRLIGIHGAEAEWETGQRPRFYCWFGATGVVV